MFAEFLLLLLIFPLSALLCWVNSWFNKFFTCGVGFVLLLTISGLSVLI